MKSWRVKHIDQRNDNSDSSDRRLDNGRPHTAERAAKIDKV